MSRESFRRWLTREIGRLDRGDSTACDAVATATRKAALLGLPELVRDGQKIDAANQPGDALPFLASCIAACCEQKGPLGERLLTVAEAAQEAGVGLSTMYALCDRGQIESVRIGQGRGTVRISKNALAGLRRKGASRWQAKAARITLHEALSA
ncbi:MAG: helix-turn-helix domain-containing protein [Pirellulaceae bacterium]